MSKAPTKATPKGTGRALKQAMRAFDALKTACSSDEELQPGDGVLPESQYEAKERARHIREVLERADVVIDRFVLTDLEGTDGPRWHVAPMIEHDAELRLVIDPFLARAPQSFDDWKKQLGVGRTEILTAQALAEESEQELLAPTTLAAPPTVGETQLGGEGTEEDAHSLARLLRAWLADPRDADQPARFRKMFGETTWRALQTRYPKLILQVEQAKK